MSPWIVTMDALEPYRCESPVQSPEPLPYLKSKRKDNSFDIKLQAFLETENGDSNLLSETNFKYMYWTINQQLTHHTSNGCNVRAGDLMGSGTISGPTKESYGSLLELTWGGKNEIQLKDGSTRIFLNDGDRITLKGFCKNNETSIGFGTCSNKIIPIFNKKNNK